MKLISVKHAAWAAFVVLAWSEVVAYVIYASQEVKPPLVPYVAAMIAVGLLLAALTFFAVRVSVDKIWKTLFVSSTIGVVASALQILFDVLQGKTVWLSLLGIVPWLCGFIGLWVSRNEPFWKNIKPRRKLHN